MGYKSNYMKKFMSKGTIAHFVRAYGEGADRFKTDFREHFTYNWQEYDDDNGLGDWWRDIPDLIKMKTTIDDSQIRHEFDDMTMCSYNTTPADRFNADAQTYHFVNECEDMMCIRNMERLGIKPVQLLSAAYPNMEFSVLTIDDKGRSACSRIQNGVVQAMPDKYITMKHYETPVICEFEADHMMRPIDKSKLNVLERMAEPMSGQMNEAQVVQENEKQSFSTYGKVLKESPFVRTMDSRVYIVQANGISDKIFREKWQQFTHTYEDYDEKTGDYVFHPDLISMEALRQNLQDPELRQQYENLGETTSPVVGGKNHISMDLCKEIPNSFVCEARESLGRQPLELLSRAFPEASFDVLQVDHKRHAKCFKIENGVSTRMPDAYMSFDVYNSREDFSLNIDHSLQPVVEADRKLNAFERMRQEKQNADVSAQSDKNISDDIEKC